MLEVSKSALRQWADSGRVRAFRTPGGHRRFSRGDIYTLLEQRDRTTGSAVSASWSETALRRIRRRLAASRTAPPAWFDQVEEARRARLRLFGHRLLDLASEYITQRRHRPRLLGEARLIGQEYGEEMARSQTPVFQVMEAFLFFRSAITEALLEAVPDLALRGDELKQLFQQVTAVADAVLLGVAHAYDQRIAIPAGGG